MKYSFILLLILLVGCSLNADQESALNKAVSSYMNACNTGAVLSYVSFTHPDVVRHYRAQGDSTFQKRFTLVTVDDGGTFLQDGTIREIQSKENQIHVLYEFLIVKSRLFVETAEEKNIVAISEDNGVTWFFADEKDYKNEEIFKSNERLLN